MKEQIFDLEEVYDEEISPLMKDIITICKRVGMPMLASFCYKANECEGHDYCTTSLPGGEFYPDEFKEALSILRNGASTRTKAFAFTIAGAK
jgi:hypothetical protein